MNSKIIAVVIVAILAVAGIGVVVLTTGNDDSYKTVETNRLVVYGNAILMQNKTRKICFSERKNAAAD